LESSDALRLGLEILQRIYVCQRAFVVAEARPGSIFSSWKRIIQSLDNLVLVKATDQHPLAEEELLLSSALPRKTLAEFAAGTAEVIVVKAETAYDLARAVSTGFPAIEALVTVTGSGIPAPRNLRVRIGTPLSAILDGCGVAPESLGKVVAGDTLRGWAQFDERTGIGREAHSLILTKREEVEVLSEEPCLRCGWCLEVCPQDLNPARLYQACRPGSWDEAAAYGLGECSECGACAWACPSHIKLVHWFQFAKRELSQHGPGSDRPLAA
jgi:electron transport complex protein RnfC